MKKLFDCVEMKNSSQKIIFEETKNLSAEEHLAYWRKKAHKFSKSRHSVRKPMKRVEV